MSDQNPKPDSWPSRLEARLDERLKSLWEEYRFWVYVWGGLFLLVAIYFAPSTFVTVHPGEQGILFRRFGGGTVTDQTYPEGMHLIPPWDTLYLYNVRVQRQAVTFPVLSREGLEVGIQVSVSFHPRIEQLGLLHKRVGPGYFERIIEPAVISRMRALAATLSAEELASTRREVVEQLLADNIRQLNDSFLVLDALAIEKVTLPEAVQAAVQARVRAQQLALEYDARLQAERKEAERKRIEAEGIRDFQNTVSQGISDALLRWRGIEATLDLAKSENAKVVVIGAGKDGLPLILDTANPGPRSAAPPPQAPSPGASPAPQKGNAPPQATR